MFSSSSIPTPKLPPSTDRVPIDHNLCSVLSTLQLWHTTNDGPVKKTSTIQVLGKQSRTYIAFAQEASRAGMSNEIILTAVIAHVIMSGWPGTALHEQRIREIREDHRIMLRHNIPLSNNICAIYDEVKDDVARFSTDGSLSMHQKVLRIHNFIARIQFPTFFVTLTKYRLLEIAYDLASAWSKFPAVRSVSDAVETEAESSSGHGSTGSYKQEIDRLRGMADSLPYKDELPMDLLSMPVSKQQRVGSRRAPDPMMLVNFDRHTSILMRVWQWVLVDIRQITVWFETAADMVAYPVYMQLCLDRGMEICTFHGQIPIHAHQERGKLTSLISDAEMALYLQQYSDAMVHWLDFP